MKDNFRIILLLLIAFAGQSLLAQTPVKMGTTAANFLEIGVGSAAVGMGSAYTTIAEDVSAIYWNPAKIAWLQNSEVMFMHQPWLVGINFNYLGFALPLQNVGVLGLGLSMLNSGEIEETTLDYQDGTGATYDATSMAFSLSFARDLTSYFSFGFSGKYIRERVATMAASALAVDLGVYVVTPFFQRPESKIQGIQIGMCISNYGGKMRLAGNDTYIAHDADPDHSGDNDKIDAHYSMGEYNLPTSFRVGLAYDLMNSKTHRITLATDAYHPNNNYEYVNAGVQYRISLWESLELKLRGGYKTLFLKDSVQGLSLGFGMRLKSSATGTLRLDYGYSDMGELGKVNSYTLSLLF